MEPAEESDRSLLSAGTPGVLFRGCTLACGVCGRRGLFRRWVSMVDQCPRCGLQFERVEGHWIGAVGMNTVVTFGLVIVTLVVVFVTTPDDPPSPWWVVAISAAFGVVPLVLYPLSKTLWTAIDLLMRPPSRAEVRDPTEWT